MTNLVFNQELNGIELYFDNKPMQNILDSLKECGFRWSNFKKCWYAKQNEKTLEEAEKYTKIETITEVKTEKRTIIKEQTNLLLWDRVQFIEGTSDNSKNNYKFVGSNYCALTVKEIAVEIRKILKSAFPEIKFSITSDYNTIDVTIKSSPYNYSKLEYSYEIESRKYREYEEEHNKELNSIIDYCNKLLSSYNFDDSDSQSDYFHKNFYQHVNIDYKYIQTEQTEEQKADILNFRNKLQQEAQAEEERKEIEYQQREKEKEEDNKQYLLRQEEEKKEIELIYNNINIIELEETTKYFVIGSQFANCNKNNTLDQYKEEVLKGDCYLQNVKITREIHFKTEESLNYFSNMLLNDFDFLSESGGSFTDDVRVKSMTDYHHMSKEEQETVIFNLYGIAVYYNNQLQFVVDTQGYSYARYVGLVENVKIQKNDIIKQFVNNEQLTELKNKAEMITDISTTIITDLDIVKTWNNENWNEYKELFKGELKRYNIKLSKSIIQQLTEDEENLKVAMYKLLIEVDGIQEQFKNAALHQGQKLTMFYISDWGSMVTSRITLDKVEYTKYAQHDNAVKITYTPQGKRKQYYNYHYSTILVYDGWLELPEEVLHEVVSDNGNIRMTKTKYGSCDKKQYDEIINYFIEQGIKPIINTYKPIF